MPGPTSLNSFIFSHTIDAAFLHEMYEEDYQYIEVIFEKVLDGFDENLQALQDNHRDKNLELLRKSVHKIKPSFGFVGLPAVQEKCRDFEAKCQAATSVNELDAHFAALMKSLQDARTIITEEYSRLKSFNQTNP
jgi:HPt (histidine-containing phosphotransfer) domain-containing protein